jgi:hypothetical protein
MVLDANHRAITGYAPDMSAEPSRRQHWELDRLLYEEAVSRGVDYARNPSGTEYLARPVDLIATATELTPGLAVVALVLGRPPASGDDERTEALRLTRAMSAALVRLAHWAREVHARDVGYHTEAWIEQTLALAGHLSDEQHADAAFVTDHLGEATVHLAQTIRALHTDHLAVPDSISRAQAAWLATYRRAREALV